MRALLVVNPLATSTTAGGRDVIAHALAADVELSVAHTDHRGHAAQLARQSAARGTELVVVHGGDGTVNEVVNGLLVDGRERGSGGAAPALGIVPGGAANVFARALGVPRDPLEATHDLLAAIEVSRTRAVGLGHAAFGNGTGRWFTFNAGLGWDADVVASVDRIRRKRTSQTLYARVALANYLWQTLRGPRLTVEIAGSAAVEGVRAAFISNGDPWSYLGKRPIRLNPGCSFDAGIGVFALRSMWAPTVLRHLAQAVSASPDPRGSALVRADDVPLVRVSSDNPVPLQVDGDLVGDQTRVEFTAVPEALRVVV